MKFGEKMNLWLDLNRRIEGDAEEMKIFRLNLFNFVYRFTNKETLEVGKTKMVHGSSMGWKTWIYINKKRAVNEHCNITHWCNGKFGAVYISRRNQNLEIYDPKLDRKGDAYTIFEETTNLILRNDCANKFVGGATTDLSPIRQNM